MANQFKVSIIKFKMKTMRLLSFFIAFEIYCFWREDLNRRAHLRSSLSHLWATSRTITNHQHLEVHENIWSVCANNSAFDHLPGRPQLTAELSTSKVSISTGNFQLESFKSSVNWVPNVLPPPASSRVWIKCTIFPKIKLNLTTFVLQGMIKTSSLNTSRLWISEQSIW